MDILRIGLIINSFSLQLWNSNPVCVSQRVYNIGCVPSNIKGHYLWFSLYFLLCMFMIVTLSSLVVHLSALTAVTSNGFRHLFAKGAHQLAFIQYSACIQNSEVTQWFWIRRKQPKMNSKLSFVHAFMRCLLLPAGKWIRAGIYQ